jgi:NAD-dependent dihydropyrimidine dehydrogenase PreA subunit
MECKEAGRVVPVIDRNKCEGKNDCVEVCPHDVFVLGKLDEEQRRSLSTLGRIKSFFHGYQQAMIVAPEACHACGVCVTSCPEKAIKLSST